MASRPCKPAVLMAPRGPTRSLPPVAASFQLVRGLHPIQALSVSDGILALRSYPWRQVFNLSVSSRGLDELVDLPPRLEPVDVAGERPFMHFEKEFNGFRFVARFAWIFGRDNLLDINRHDQPICLDQSRPLHSLAWYTHALALFGGVVVIQKINSDKFSNAGLSEMAPYRSAITAVGKQKANLHGWIRSCASPFGK